MESYEAESMKPLKANFDVVPKGQLENFFIDIKKSVRLLGMESCKAAINYLTVL